MLCSYIIKINVTVRSSQNILLGSKMNFSAMKSPLAKNNY